MRRGANFSSKPMRRVQIEPSGDATVALLIGAEEFPFPFPLVKPATGWNFDSKDGAEEVLHRRIGPNERSAIQVCLTTRFSLSGARTPRAALTATSCAAS